MYNARDSRPTNTYNVFMFTDNNEHPNFLSTIIHPYLFSMFNSRPMIQGQQSINQSQVCVPRVHVAGPGHHGAGALQRQGRLARRPG